MNSDDKTQIGIDTITFSTSSYFLPLKTLAEHRNVDYRKYYEGIGQEVMSVFPPNEDIVTIAIDAARKVLKKIADKNEIDLLIFATESSFDLSKAAAVYLHHFLELKPNCRAFDVKQACYSATAALQMARTFIQANPKSKVLIVGSDIVKYSPNTSGEPTQGGAAVAMIISENPRTIALETYSGIHTDDIADFWRPATASEAMFDGRLSAYNYLKSLGFALQRYCDCSGLTLTGDIDYVCLHSPFNKMARKAAHQFFPDKNISDTLFYNALIGNSCSASLYISLISLLDHCSIDLAGKRIGLYSYGSGSVAEFFSGIVPNSYKSALFSENHQNILRNRFEISFAEYEKLCTIPYGATFEGKKYKNCGITTLSEVKNGYRIYEDRPF